ncbi:serine hydrolase domain-containing protein [Nonomuraea sp. NPDC050547]|uniref:serine hydrolase domain-containing protein n=1 Tax=Nonomuraea sp. NPDC050547 TaxID=3364368 RepID=UPI0037912659
MENFIQATAESLGVVGAQAAVVKGETVRSYAAGLADARHGTPVDDGTLFQIGSTTKLYTAAMLMRLADDGRLDIDAPVSGHLPEHDLGPITARHLMSMTSGLDNGPYVDTGRGDDCVAAYVRRLAGIPPLFEPGAGFGYSNASTVVSGLLVERITGRCWDDALRDLLLEPAGLARTASLADELLYHRVALGHTREREVVKPFFFSRGLGPSGSTLCASALDLVAFGRLFLHGGVLSADALKEIHTPHAEVPARCFADHWCAGPYLKIWDGVRVYGHSGTTPSGSSTLNWIPEHDLVVATIVNVAERGYRFADAVIREIVRAETGVVKPALPEPDPGLSVAPEPYTGRYGAHDLLYEVTAADGRLHAVIHGPGGSLASTDLLPLGEHRFLPADDAFTGHHMWDVAFVMGADGRAIRLLNGAFAARSL